MKAFLVFAAWFTLWLVIGGGSAQAEPVKIRIGWVVTPAELAPIMFAKEGIARHNGVTYTVEPVHFRGSTLQVTAIHSGDLDIAAFGSNSFPIAVENAGLSDLRIIADELRIVPGWSGPEFRVLKDGSIKTVADLKGKVALLVACQSATDQNRTADDENTACEKWTLTPIPCYVIEIPCYAPQNSLFLIVGNLAREPRWNGPFFGLGRPEIGPESSKSLQNSLLAGNSGPESGSLETASTARQSAVPCVLHSTPRKAP